MNTLNIFNIKHTIPKDELKSIVILIVSVFILAIHKCFGTVQFITKSFPDVSEYNSVINMFVLTFILLAIIPIFLIRFFFKESLREYGLNIGDWKKGFKSIAVFYPLIAAFILYPSVYDKELLNFYPQSKEIAASTSAFLKFEAIRILLFYSGWEIFFRGFMLFGLRKYVGDSIAICIQIIPSCLWHIGMSTGEIFASIFGGVLFGFMSLRTKSVIYPFILHSLIGLTLDLFIVLSVIQQEGVLK